MSIVRKIKEGLVAEKERKLLEIDPDRFYVENIRSFYNLTTPVARFLCELAVKQGLFNKKIGLMCPNDGCGRIIKSYRPSEPVDDLLTCETCELLNRKSFEFPSDSLERMPFYQLRTKIGTGRSEKIQLVEKETGEMELVEPKETREIKLDELENARQALYHDLENKFKIGRIIANLGWKSVFFLTVFVTFIVVLVFLLRAKSLEERVLLATFDAMIAATILHMIDIAIRIKQHVDMNKKT